VLDVGSARDALVLKALALVLQVHLPSSRRCTHLKGHGGSKGAVRAVRAALPAHRFVCKSDVRSFYDSIDHTRLLDRVARSVPDRGVLNRVGQYLRRTAEAGGWYSTATRGLSLGCPLSPVLGAFFLLDLDRAPEGTGLFYVRFMDDIVVLAPTRWKLRAAEMSSRIFGVATPSPAPPLCIAAVLAKALSAKAAARARRPEPDSARGALLSTASRRNP
jgi:RNA-directed DNA polymerase